MMKEAVTQALKVIKQPAKKGFTLTEILLAVAILGFALCSILATYISGFVLTATSKNINIATSVASGLMEEIRSASFAALRDGELQINNQSFIAIDDNLFACNFTVDPIPSSMAVVYVDNINPELLNLTISICWRQGNRIIGEDNNLNGRLDPGEDKIPHNGLIDSPVELVTQIANR